MEEKPDFKPFVPADRVAPEFTVVSLLLGCLLAVLFGGANAYLGLRVGMNVRLNIVTQKKENVWAVPFEAVGTDAQGQSVVYVAKPNEEGAMIATAVPVTTGMETDFYLEISSDGLADGDQVLSDASTVIPGMPVTLAAGWRGGSRGCRRRRLPGDTSAAGGWP